MFLELTNASPAHRGNALAIRRDLVVTVYSNAQIRDDGTVDPVTFIFAPPHGTWEVQETFDQVMELLRAA